MLQESWKTACIVGARTRDGQKPPAERQDGNPYQKSSWRSAEREQLTLVPFPFGAAWLPTPRRVADLSLSAAS
jgi:hypothetical protein